MQDGWCTSPSGETARFRVHDERGGRLDGLRVYAGLRSDPFFIDLPAWQESLETGRLAFKQEGQNSLAGFNVLGVVVEVDGKLLLKNGGPPLLAVVGETVVAGKLPIRIERFGRPEIKNHILSMKEFDQVNRDLEVRDLYNLEDAFHMSKDYRGAYRARLNANLAAIDRLDGKTDWPLGPTAPTRSPSCCSTIIWWWTSPSRTPRTASSRSNGRRCRDARTRRAGADR